MHDFEVLDQSLTEQRDRTARFVPAAFHVHSIDSHDWAKEGDEERNQRSSFDGSTGQDRFLDELRDAGIEVVCVTDHMKSEYACALSAKAAQRPDITVFPGMEISCLVPPGHSEAIHVLAIYPERTTPDVIERLFADQANLPGLDGRDGSEKAHFESLEVVRNRVDAAGGLFILAHIDQHPRGHRDLVRSERGSTAEMFSIDVHDRESVTQISYEYAEHLAALNPHAVEVMKSGDRQHYWSFKTADGLTHRFACLARSDHHNVETFRDPDLLTHVKVSRIDLECIRSALDFHETRVRFSEDLPTEEVPKILGMRIRGSGLFEDAEIAFNENLSSLIGPRGCGKSTIIEALRYVLGQRPALDAATNSENHSYASLAIATQNANLKDCEIELIYEQRDESHMLAATFDPEKGVATKAFKLDGQDLQVATEAISTAYPARIFSWSELETLGREPALQRVVIDRLIEEFPSLSERLAEALAALQDNRGSIVSLRKRLVRLFSEDDGALSRFTERKSRFDHLNTAEVQSLFVELDKVRERESLLQTIDAQLASVEAQAHTFSEPNLERLTNESLASGTEYIRKWWTETAAPRIDLPGLTEDLAEHGAQLMSLIQGRRLTISTELSELETLAKAHERSIREETQADPEEAIRRDQREESRIQLDRSATIRDAYVATYLEMEDLLQYRSTLLDGVRELEARIGDQRETKATELANDISDLQVQGQTIVVTVTQTGDRQELSQFLNEEFLDLDRAGHYRARGVADRLATVDPAVIATCVLHQNADPLVAADSLTEQEAKKLVNAFTVFAPNIDADVMCALEELDELLELQEQKVDDLVRIESNGRPVDELSPGGRSSAMLPLVALSETVPLIIDQPEDNLDNRMVGQTLSLIFSRLKERRQIILTTHNPNIVVGGDAEQVVVLNSANATDATVESTGSIDSPEIIDSVIKIMEGGREAFEERSRRYKSNLENPT